MLGGAIASVASNLASNVLGDDDDSSSSGSSGGGLADKLSGALGGAIDDTSGTEGKEDVLQTDDDGSVDKQKTADELMEKQNINTVENMIMQHKVTANAEDNKTLISNAKKNGETQAAAARATA
jgi:hypothetical protein